jgi:hypothetical protein
MAVAATDVASFDASPEKATLEANLKNELSCLEPACFLELRATEAVAGRRMADARRLASASGINVEVILTIPDTAPDGSQATAADITLTVEEAATTLVSAPAAQLASRLGVEATPDVTSVATAANVNVALVVAPPPPSSPPPSSPPPSSPSPSPAPPPPAQNPSDSPSAAPNTATTKVLEAEEAAIEADGGDDLAVPIGIGAGGVVALALGALVLFLLRRRKQKLRLVTLGAAGAAGSSSGDEPNKAQHASKEATAVKDSEASEAGGEAAVVISPEVSVPLSQRKSFSDTI